MQCERQRLELDVGVGSCTARDLPAQQYRRMIIEFREPFPPLTDVRQLEQVGFSSEQIVDLFRVKALYQRGAYHEANPEYERQAFIRWLYLQGRLQS